MTVFIFMFCGCSNEPLLVEIAYETQAISESTDANVESAPLAGDAGLVNEAQNQNNDAVNAAFSQAEGAVGTPQAAYRAGAALAPSPAATQTPQPTFTPWPTPTPTITPSPTPKPTPTVTPLPTPTAAPSPSPKATANLQAAIDAETERYEKAIKSIQDEYDMRISPLSGMLGNLQGKTASSPEDAAALQAEIDELQARIDAQASEAAAKMDAELERHLAAIASLGG
ncbi:MAG: hypothetical protein VB051_09675 [Candidatus Pelethousia sp.]|nr:hypothetical protein [Candidatus Pelethousia sp.]